MDIKDVLEGITVVGKDINGNKIQGNVLEFGRGFGIATIKIGEDRLSRTIAHVNDIERIEE